MNTQQNLSSQTQNREGADLIALLFFSWVPPISTVF